MYLIVGVDPGKTIGIACVDLKGRLVSSGHYSNESLATVVGKIKVVGTPIVIAGDKTHTSDLVRKVNATFGCHLFSPKREFSLDLKRRMGRTANLMNQHECDAYAAAISAYNHYSNKFHQIEGMGKDEAEVEKIKRQVVTKHSIYEATTGKKANRK